MVDISNPTLTKDGITVTIYVSDNVEYTGQKLLTLIKAPTSTGNQGDTGVVGSIPKETKILDLLRKEERITIGGYIDSTDIQNLLNMFRAGGTCTLTWDASAFTASPVTPGNPSAGTFIVAIEKVRINRPANEEQDERQVTLTLVIGVDL